MFIEDVRANGHYLRATWHPEGGMFVVSTWRAEVCTGAVRLPAEAAADLAGLLIEGLAEAAAHPPRPATTAERWTAPLRRWAGRLRRKLR